MARAGRRDSAADVGAAGRELFAAGFFEREHGGVFAVTFQGGCEQVFGYASSAGSRSPGLLLFPGEQGFFPFWAVMQHEPPESPVFEAAHVLGVSFRPLGLVPPDFRCFAAAGLADPIPEEIVGFCFADPACAGRRPPDAEETEILAICLRALVEANRSGPLPLLPTGRSEGHFPEVRVRRRPGGTEVSVHSGLFGTGIPRNRAAP